MAKTQKVTPARIEKMYDAGENRVTEERNDFLLPQIRDFVREKKWLKSASGVSASFQSSAFGLTRRSFIARRVGRQTLAARGLRRVSGVGFQVAAKTRCQVSGGRCQASDTRRQAAGGRA